MLKGYVAVALFALAMLVPSSVQAKVYQLTYTGQAFTHDFGPDLFGPPSAYSGEILIDGSAFGNSLAGKTITYFGISSFYGPSLSGVGLISWTHSIPLYSCCGTEVSFSFDAQEQISKWKIDALDGPPDLWSTQFGDGLYVGDDQYSAPPGSWHVAAIPLPAPVGLLAFGLAGLVALRWRRSCCP